MMFDYEMFRVNLLLQRKKLRITQEQLADLADISEKNLSQIESSNHKPNLQTILSILNALNTTPTAFMLSKSNDNKVAIDSINGYLNRLNEKEKKFVLDLIINIHEEV